MIDVNQLLLKYSVEELCQTANEYFESIGDPEYHLIKPFGKPNEAAAILSHFSAMIILLDLNENSKLLDFGAGTGWTSRYFAQMGVDVTATDVSKRALEIAQIMMEKIPVLGTRPPVKYNVFNGRELDFEDSQFDRIAIMDAFHHVPNQLEVLRELNRVLCEGGRVVMVEPGPDHSRSEQSQHEMRNFKVVERDIDEREIENLALEAGFDDVFVGIYSGSPYLAPASRFQEELVAGRAAAEATRNFLSNHRLFLLQKHSESKITSRNSQLSADLSVTKLGARRFRANIRNTSQGTWLGTSAQIGVVNLGAHLRSSSGDIIDLDFFRTQLRQDGKPVHPDEELELEFVITTPTDDGQLLEFDLVAEGIAWFAEHGSETEVLSVRV